MDHSWGYGSEQRLRNENQDSHGVFEFPDFTLAIVCDGMGGHVGGAQAAVLAIRTIHDSLRNADLSNIPNALSEAIQAANLAIYEAARRNHRLTGMGTTVVLAALTDEVAWFGHVGDSRAYLVRGGTVRQMTRDHTMVNLFVDAELLTPEDAATHPEAHVLSRSLGVERQVDVEISEPVPLEPEDVVFLCSDGVHGVITDWEIANVDWGAPHEGVRHVLDIVISREGDDNATAVAVLCATSFEDVPATPLPELKRFDDGLAEMGAGVTVVPPEEDVVPQEYLEEMPSASTPPPQARPVPPPLDEPSYVVFDEEQEPAPIEVEPEAPPVVRPGEARPVDRLLPRGMLVGLVAATVLCGGLGAGAASLFLGGSSGTPAPHEGPGSEQTAMIAVSGAPSLQEAATESKADPQAAPSEVPELAPGQLFAPELPAAPRRLPHRPVRFTQPPPGGSTQWEAVQAARNHECRRALDAVARGMRFSVDHATLYNQAWFCFNEVHQRPLLEAQAETWEDFALLLPAFEGLPEDREALDEATRRLPEWFQPAVGGIEYRLAAYQNSTREDKLAEVAADLLGEPTLADHLGNDLLLEALAAAGLSRVEDPNPRVINWWARRVYVLTSALDGRIGRLLEAHRPDLLEQVRTLLDQATSPRPVAPPDADPDAPPPRPIPVPEVVLQARQVAMGLAPAPNAARPTSTAREPRIVEPDLDELQELERAKIYRR